MGVGSLSERSKIRSSHLERVAMVYVRQSSLAQVREHTESTARQYALADRAVAAGWPRARVEVVDDDLGVSGASTEGRAGYLGLVARVCLGEVGAVFGLEVSRLARSSADLSRLLELARLTDTLVIDGDGVYDLSDFNDRLLLGLKSTMSEAELHLLAGRLQGAKRAAAARGVLRVPLPVGMVYDEGGGVVIDPDQEVAAALRGVFSAFEQTGSAYGVVGAFADRRFPKRAYGGAWAGVLRWGALTHSRVLGILSNPCYAGAYVYGRRRTRRMVEPDGTVRSRTELRALDAWEVVIRDHHVGYVDWGAFLVNRARLAANRTNGGERPVREGAALCQGIIVCGSCGRAMSTRYQGERGYYECSHARSDHVATRSCRCVRADVIDEVVAQRLLRALEPDQVALALAATDEVRDRRERGVRAAELALERARFDADRAERALTLVEPENRLVARTLEVRWEEKLSALAESEQRLAAARSKQQPLPPRERLERLAADLPALWVAPSTAHRDRKRLLRTLVADVSVLPESDQSRVRIGIRWHSGAADELSLLRPQSGAEQRRTDPAAIAFVREFGATRSNAELADALNAAGYTTGVGRAFDRVAVTNLRHYHGLCVEGVLQAGEVSVNDVARRLGISYGSVNYWIKRGWLEARRAPGGRWAVPFNAEIEAACRARITASRQLPHHNRNAPPRQPDERSVNEVASALEVNTDVVYYWLQRGHLKARQDAGGRWCIPFPPDTQAACRQRVNDSNHITKTPSRTTAERMAV